MSVVAAVFEVIGVVILGLIALAWGVIALAVLIWFPCHIIGAFVYDFRHRNQPPEPRAWLASSIPAGGVARPDEEAP